MRWKREKKRKEKKEEKRNLIGKMHQVGALVGIDCQTEGPRAHTHTHTRRDEMIRVFFSFFLYGGR
jgi:hypothetical protein